MGSRDRRRKVEAVMSGMRDMGIELAVLNHRIGNQVELKDLDFDCLDVIARHGPISPTALAERVGVHMATLTGILNRLERGEWITRDRSQDDRRAVIVASTADRQRDLYRAFGPMNKRMHSVCDQFSDDELATIADFLSRTVDAGRTSADEIG